MSEKFAFMFSSRFWVLILGSAGTVLSNPEFATLPWYTSLGKFLGLLSAGFITIRTIDRMGDKKVEAAEITNE